MSVKVTFVGCGDAFGSGGRFNTCILVEGRSTRFTIDFGATSLVALNKLGIEHNSIDAILLTHLHGDHFGGVPFLLLDAMLGARRTRPLTIAGPAATQARVTAAMDALFPGSHVMRPKFELNYVVLPVGETKKVCDLAITTRAARHTPQTEPTAMRVAVDDKVVAYTGDGEWSKDLSDISRDADLFIAECYFHAKSITGHMSYPDIQEHGASFGAKRTMLTHLGPEMLAQRDTVVEDCAHDGMSVDLG